MRLRRGTTRFAGGAPILFQALPYAFASIVALVATVVALYAGLGAAPTGTESLIVVDALAAVAGVAASLIANSFLAFGSGVLFRGSVLRRFLLANLLGVAVHVPVFALLAGGRLDPAALDLPTVTAVALGACTAQYAVTFVVLHLWAYRLPPIKRTARPMDLAYVNTPLDVELMSIAGGERMAFGLWRRREWLAAYAAVFAAFLAYGWYGIVHLGMSTGDGGARVIQAFQVMFGRHPHLGALGFVWPPIPSLSDIPFLLFLQPLGQPFFAGTIMGSLYAAGAVLLFFAVLREAGAGRTLALLLTLGLATSEQFVQTSVAGLSEPVVACFLLASLLAFLKWLREPRPGLVAAAGIATGGAILCRYEAAFWAAAMGAGMFLVLYGGVPGLPVFRTRRDAQDRSAASAASNLLAFVLPSGFALGVWIYLSAQIVGSPLYFLTGAGSTKSSPDTAALAGANLATYGPAGATVYHAYHSLSGTVGLVFDRVGTFSPLLLVFTAVLLVHAIRRREPRSLAILMVTWSVPAFGIVTGYLGSLPPYTRYWYWAAPMGAVAAAYAMELGGNRALRAVLAPVLVVAMFMPVVRTFVATYQGVEGPVSTAERWQNALLTNSDFGSVAARRAAVVELKRVAGTVNALVPPDQTVLLDISTGGGIVLFAHHPGQFITSTDPDFRAPVLQEPWRLVDFILAPEPTYDVVTRSLLFEVWPDVWKPGYDWLSVVDEVPGTYHWKLLQTSPGAVSAR